MQVPRYGHAARPRVIMAGAKQEENGTEVMGKDGGGPELVFVWKQKCCDRSIRFSYAPDFRAVGKHVDREDAESFANRQLVLATVVLVHITPIAG